MQPPADVDPATVRKTEQFSSNIISLNISAAFAVSLEVNDKHRISTRRTFSKKLPCQKLQNPVIWPERKLQVPPQQQKCFKHIPEHSRLKLDHS